MARGLIGLALVLAVLLLSGPGILLLIDVIGNGATRGNVSALGSLLAVYLVWIAALSWRIVVGRHLRWWAYVGLFVASYLALMVGALVAELPVVSTLPAGLTFKQDGLQFIILITLLPWLVAQYTLFVVILRLMPVAESDQKVLS